MILARARRPEVTPRVNVHVPDELLAVARRALGLPESANRGVIVRTALATAGGVSPDAYPLAKRGPKPGQRRKGKAA